MKTRTTFLLFSFLSFLSVSAQTPIQGGDVYGDWFLNGSPYLIQGDIHLPSNQRLRIWPGVQVIFLGESGFEVEGKLDATGNINDSISFTAYDTTGYSQSNYSGWNGIYFNGLNYSFADSTVMAYCNIQFSQYSGIICDNYPNFIIKHSAIRNNHSSGIVLYESSNIKAESIIISSNYSGGLLCWNSSPQVSNFIIENNSGSGLKINGNTAGSINPLFIDGKIRNNTSSNNGGGININTDAYVSFFNLEIIGNSAVKGGAVYCGMANCEFTGTILRGNYAIKGGGTYGDNFSNITLSRSTIAKNIAEVTGGGFYMNQGVLNLNNCTVSNNTAGETAGGLYYNCYIGSAGEILNTILWNNIPNELVSTVNEPQVSFSDIFGGFAGTGNIDADPLFVDPSNDDFNLTWSGFPEENITKSPCIDAGDPNSNIDPDGTKTDMGAWFYDQGIYTGIANNTTNIADFNVFPIPAQNFININSSINFDYITIINLNGEMVTSHAATNSTERIYVTDFKPGFYFLQVYYGRELIITKKIIIE